MKFYLILLILIFFITNSKVINHKFNHRLNSQYNQNKKYISSNQHHLQNNSNYQQSSQYNDNNQTNPIQKTQNHRQFIQGAALLFDAGKFVYENFIKSDSKSQSQPANNSNYLVKSQDNFNTNAAQFQALQRKNCSQGLVLYQKEDKCIKCQDPTLAVFYNSVTDTLKCGYNNSPFIQVSQSVGATQAQCILPNRYDPIQKICSYCPKNFVIDIDINTKRLLCWCDPPNVMKPISGVQTCQVNSKTNPTKTQHICPTGSLWDETTKQCMHCPLKNFVLQLNQSTNKNQCYCNAPFKLTTLQNGDMKCQ